MWRKLRRMNHMRVTKGHAPPSERPLYAPAAQSSTGMLSAQLALNLHCACVPTTVFADCGQVAVSFGGQVVGRDRVLAKASSGVGRGSRALTRHAHRILIVEDDPDAAETLQVMLSTHGHVVEVAHSVAAARIKLQQPWDVVISNLGLPDGSGLDIALEARSLPKPPAKLIALTGRGAQEDIEATRKAGFDAHLVKPVPPADVAALVEGPLTRDVPS